MNRTIIQYSSSIIERCRLCCPHKPLQAAATVPCNLFCSFKRSTYWLYVERLKLQKRWQDILQISAVTMFTVLQ